MKKRIISAIVIVFILFAFLALRFLEISVFDFMVLGINLIACYEVSSCNIKAKNNNFFYIELFFVLATYLGLTICFAYNLSLIYPMIVVFGILLLSIISMPLLAMIQKDKLLEDFNALNSQTLTFKSYKKQIYINTIKILLYPSLLLTCIYFLNNISKLNFVAISNTVDFGWFLLTLIFTISMSTDTFAFFTGKLLKGPKLAPKISPNKTISGAVGGLAFGMMATALLFYLFNLIPIYKALFTKINLSVYHIIMIGMEGSIANQIGDLYESYAKRKLGVKDFGNLFPGHGGIMDRVDGLSFVAFVVLILFLIALA